MSDLSFLFALVAAFIIAVAFLGGYAVASRKSQ